MVSLFVTLAAMAQAPIKPTLNFDFAANVTIHGKPSGGGGMRPPGPPPAPAPPPGSILAFKQRCAGCARLLSPHHTSLSNTPPRPT